MVAPMSTVDGYLQKLPADRRSVLTVVRDTINANLPSGFEEGLQYGMIGWFVPLSRYPDTYNKQPLCLLGLASKKNYMALHLMNAYVDAQTNTWFRKAFVETGKKLDMGAGCLRFKKLDDLPLHLIGELVGRVDADTYVAMVKSVVANRKKTSAKPKKAAAKKATAKLKKKATAKPKKKAARR